MDDTLYPEDRSRLEEIKSIDPAAVILNGYYCGQDVYKRQAQTIPGGAASAPTADAPPLPHAPGAEREQDTAAAERVIEHIDGAHTRKASKKAARKAQAEAEARTRTSRLQFTDEERATPELERDIRKSDKRCV